jgi:hypothetical protein
VSISAHENNKSKRVAYATKYLDILQIGTQISSKWSSTEVKGKNINKSQDVLLVGT